MCMWINNEASSSTLVEGLAPHNHKRHYKINWNHEKVKLTIEKRSQRPMHDKSRDFALYCASQRRVYKTKMLIYTKQLGFLACWQVITSALDCNGCDRSHYARSWFLHLIASMASKLLAAWHSNDESRVSNDVAYAQSQFVRSIAQPGEPMCYCTL